MFSLDNLIFAFIAPLDYEIRCEISCELFCEIPIKREKMDIKHTTWVQKNRNGSGIFVSLELQQKPE